MYGALTGCSPRVIFSIGLCAALISSAAELMASPPAPTGEGPKTHAAVNDALPSGAVVRLGTGRFRTDGQAADVQFSPNATAIVSVNVSGEIRFWDIESGRLLRQIAGAYHANGPLVAWSNDRKRVAVLGKDGNVFMLDGVTYQDQVWPADRNQPTAKSTRKTGVVFSMDGKSLVVGSDDGKIQSLRLSDASVEQTFDAEGMRTFDFAFLEDGKKLRAACSDGKFRVWDWQTGKLQGRSQMAFLRYFSPVVSTRSGGTIFADGPLLTFWPKGGGPKLDFKAHETQITGVAVSANEKVLASVDRTGILRVWNAAGKPHLVELRCDEGDTLLTLSADGSLLAACSQEHNDRIRIWRLAHDPSGKTTATELHLDSGHKSLVKRLAFFQNGERLLSTSNDDTARLWDVKTGKCMACLEEGYWAAVSPDGRQVALHGHKASYTINVLDMTDLKRPKKYSAFDGCGPLAFSPVANRLAHLMGVKPCKVVISDLASKRPVRDFPNVTYSAYSMAYSSDGRLLAVGGADNIVRVWDVVKGQQKFSLKANPQWLAFTPNGRFLVTEKALWDMENGKLSVQLDDKVAEMTAVALPDNSRLVTGGIDRMIRVWDLKSGRLLRSIAGHTGKVYASAISPDGKRLATGGSDGEILVWDVQKTFP